MLLSKYQLTKRTKPVVLVVDDSPPNLKILSGILKPECDVITTTNGEDGLRLVTEHLPDLILLDVILPGMSGFEICEILKASPEYANIPVIFVTARDQIDEETRGFEVGAVDYITKPVRRPIVRARVFTHLELKRHRDTLEMLSTLDGLTGLFNRRYLDSYLDIEWRRSSRSSESLSLLMIDIDFFKKYNDHYGHLEGDECLKKVSKALAETLRRGGDIVCRYGGEEFCAVLPLTSLDGALKIAQAMRAAILDLALPHIGNNGGLVTVSIGVAAVIPTQDKQQVGLIHHADLLLYRAKNEGRNRVLGEEMPQA